MHLPPLKKGGRVGMKIKSLEVMMPREEIIGVIRVTLRSRACWDSSGTEIFLKNLMISGGGKGIRTLDPSVAHAVLSRRELCPHADYKR